jgi:hypothetical protein
MSGDLLHADFVVATVRNTGPMSVVEIAKMTGVRAKDVVTIILHESGRRLRQHRGRDVLAVKWEAI